MDKISGIERFIDHTLLKPEATSNDIKELCIQAKQNGFKAVCINPCHVALASSELAECDTLVCTVIGFPLGANLSEVKAFEARKAIEDGANEVDMVINIGAAKAGNMTYVQEDIKCVVDAVRGRATVKVIIECGLLSDKEKEACCFAAKEAGADFVKTSTGFNAGGAIAEDVALMRRVVGDQLQVKAAGGIRDYAKAKAMIKAGAQRIGSSAGITILAESKKQG